MKINLGMEPKEDWYKDQYTLSEYLSLCKQCMEYRLDSEYECRELYHEMMFAMQNIKEEEK